MSAKGCPGLVRVNNALVGLCIACELRGKPGKQIEPEAKRISGGEFYCPNRVIIEPQIKGDK